MQVLAASSYAALLAEAWDALPADAQDARDAAQDLCAYQATVGERSPCSPLLSTTLPALACLLQLHCEDMIWQIRDAQRYVLMACVHLQATERRRRRSLSAEKRAAPTGLAAWSPT